MFKYSVIVPVYNTHEELKTILNWFVAVTAKRAEQDVELLIVDDGSSKKLDKVLPTNVRYFYKKNGGVSSARNFGIKKAAGKFILFLDSDDAYSEDIFNVLDHYSNDESDIVTFSYNKIASKKSVMVSNKTGLYGKEDFLKNYLTKKIKLHICSCMFKREFILDNRLLFDVSISHSEDILFTINALFVAKELRIIEEVLYHYQFRNDSAINSLFGKKALSHFVALNLINNKKNKNNEQYVNYFLATCYITLIIFLLKNKTKDMSVIEAFVENKKLVDNNIFNDFSIISIVVNLFVKLNFFNDKAWAFFLKKYALISNI